MNQNAQQAQQGFRMTPWPDAGGRNPVHPGGNGVRGLPYQVEPTPVGKTSGSGSSNLNGDSGSQPAAIERERMADIRPPTLPKCDVRVMAGVGGHCVAPRGSVERFQQGTIHDGHMSQSRLARSDRMSQYLIPGMISPNTQVEVTDPFAAAPSQGVGAAGQSWRESHAHPSTCRIDDAFCISSQARMEKIKEKHERERKGVPPSPYDGIAVSSPFVGEDEGVVGYDTQRDKGQAGTARPKQKWFDGSFHDQLMREQEAKKHDPRKDFLPDPSVFRKGRGPSKPPRH